MSKIKNLKAIHNKCALIPCLRLAGFSVSKIKNLKAIHNAVDINAPVTAAGFRDLSDPERLWNVGAFAQTLSHFGKVSMTGKFAFDNEEAYKACGSMFSRSGQART